MKRRCVSNCYFREDLFIETTTGDAVAVDAYKVVAWILKLKFLQDFEIEVESKF